MVVHEQRLRRKGWSGAEIAHAQRIVARAHSARRSASEAGALVTLGILLGGFLCAFGALSAAMLSILPPYARILVTLCIGVGIGGLAHGANRMLHTVDAHAWVFALVLALIGGLAGGAGAAWAGGGGMSTGALLAVGVLIGGLAPEWRR